jgi:acyl carrier protein
VTEDKIHGIWSRELKLESFSPDDDFFSLGGHSLIMASIQTAIKDEIGVEVPMDELFRRPTVRSISEHLDKSLAAS